jgi:ribulose-phosphate 3-epimerase
VTTDGAVRIGASILTADLTCIGPSVDALQDAGVDYIHVDVMDGQFVPAITFGPPLVAGLRRVTTLPLDVHLMVLTPEKQIEPFQRAGTDSLTAHVEATRDLPGFFRQCRALGMEVGIALNPETPVEAVVPYLPLVSQVLVMSVHPGKGGQPFLEESVERIVDLHAAIDRGGHDVRIAVDGGINEETAPRVVRAGATLLVVGTAIVNHHAGLNEAVTRLRAAVNGLSAPRGPAGVPGLL